MRQTCGAFIAAVAAAGLLVLAVPPGIGPPPTPGEAGLLGPVTLVSEGR